MIAMHAFNGGTRSESVTDILCRRPLSAKQHFLAMSATAEFLFSVLPLMRSEPAEHQAIVKS